jgi:RHS repeat-associated protein
MAEQKATGTFTNPYLFNGKELDEETGLFYYGARYYNPRYSVWLGVDPMVEKYAGISPYNFTLNNPVLLVDPDGRDIDPTASGFSESEAAARNNPKFAEIYNAWKNDPSKVIKFNHISDENAGGYPGYEGKNDAGQDVFSVNWDPSLTKELGISGIYEESYHLMEAIAGKEMAFAKNTGGPETGYGVDGRDLMDEVRAKMWVVNNIKGVKATYNKNGYVYRTHYGQVMKSIESNSLATDLKYGTQLLKPMSLSNNSNQTIGGTITTESYQPTGFTGNKYGKFTLNPLYPK